MKGLIYISEKFNDELLKNKLNHMLELFHSNKFIFNKNNIIINGVIFNKLIIKVL